MPGDKALKKILLLGCSGKMGTALKDVFNQEYYSVLSINSIDFDACDFITVRVLINDCKPDIVINTVAFLGIDSCEREPQKAFILNALYPRILAELSNELGFVLVHFSTDAVFDDKKNDFYTEADSPSPINVYGLTKYGGDCFIQAIARRYYIFRLSVLFGDTSKGTQFVEKMLDKIKGGARSLSVSEDIISSPTFSMDIANEVKRVIESEYVYGLYHIANEGMASLYDLMKEIIENLRLEVKLERTSHRNFPAIGMKNTFTPIKSEKLHPLRSWQAAVKEYCSEIILEK